MKVKRYRDDWPGRKDDSAHEAEVEERNEIERAGREAMRMTDV